jgi:hypothetical protein
LSTKEYNVKERVVHIVKESRANRDALMIESAPVSKLRTLLESEDGREGVKKSLLAKLRDSSLVDVGLDILSGIGVSLETGGVAASMTGVGAVAGVPIATIGMATSVVSDVINALRHALRGDHFSAILYLIFAVPGAGDILQGVSWLSSGAKLTVKGIVELYPKLRQLAKAGKLKRVAEGAYKLLDMGMKHIPGLKKHNGPLRNTLKAVLDGDPAELARVAKESGYEVAEAELQAAVDKASGEKESRSSGDSKRSMSESTIRRAVRSRKVTDLYKGTLY